MEIRFFCTGNYVQLAHCIYIIWDILTAAPSKKNIFSYSIFIHLKLRQKKQPFGEVYLLLVSYATIHFQLRSNCWRNHTVWIQMSRSTSNNQVNNIAADLISSFFLRKDCNGETLPYTAPIGSIYVPNQIWTLEDTTVEYCKDDENGQ